MAYKDSGEIATNSNYVLGDYSFRIERSSVPGSTNDKIEAICTKGGKNARKSIQVPSSTQIGSWYVDANETEATVYVNIEKYVPKGGIPVSETIVVNTQPGTYDLHGGQGIEVNTVQINGSSVHMIGVMSETDMYVVAISDSNSPFSFTYQGVTNGNVTDGPGTVSSHSTTYKNTQIQVATYGPWYSPPPVPSIPTITSSSPEIAGIAEIMKPDGTTPKMVGRFAIEVDDAGGVGPGSDWTDPEDYDEDWEEGDPTHTLYVEVIGALSGRHNDPIEDPSYSYIPSDKDTVKDYGCGGDGGHGGGGGAGASTVVIHKFATNQANSKEVTALARRHGYGSGGGKGGKGGDGCILVYY